MDIFCLLHLCHFGLTNGNILRVGLKMKGKKMTLFGLKMGRPGLRRGPCGEASSQWLESAEPDKCILLNLYRMYYRLHLPCAEGKRNQRKER